MIFQETRLPGAYVIELDPIADERGFFARSWCEDEFRRQGLTARLAQCSVSYNVRQATLQGMHYQAQPYPEAKIVHCTKNAIYNVIINLRLDSPTFKSWIGVKLTTANRRMLYIPKCCAHGFLTLEDATEVFYQISEFYHPE